MVHEDRDCCSSQELLTRKFILKNKIKIQWFTHATVELK